MRSTYLVRNVEKTIMIRFEWSIFKAELEQVLYLFIYFEVFSLYVVLVSMVYLQLIFSVKVDIMIHIGSISIGLHEFYSFFDWQKSVIIFYMDQCHSL